MIKLNYTKQQLQDETFFVQALKEALTLHTIQVTQQVLEDKNFYIGKYPNVTTTINKAKYIVDMATEMFIGDLPDITTYSEKEKERKKLIEFNKRLKASDFAKELYDVGLNASKTGSGYLLVYTEENINFPEYASLDPELTNVVYDCSVKEKPLFGFTLLRQTEFINVYTKIEYYRVYVYTETQFFNLRTVSVNDLAISNSLPLLNLISSETQIIPHPFGVVPLIEFKNNELLLGDARPVYELLKAYNTLQNSRIQNVEDMVKYVLMLKNVRIGNEEEQENFTNMLKNHRVLALEGDNADAKFLQNALDQSDLQRLVDDIQAQIEMVSRVPNFNSAEFAQNSSEPALKLKLKGFLDLAKEKERYFSTALSQVIGMTLSYLERFGGREGAKYLFDMNDIEIEYSHNLPSNDMDKITQLVSLNTLGLLNPRVALQELSWIKNVDEYLAGVVTMSGDQMANLTNGGNNETNRLRQSLATTDPSKVDNRLANTQGVAKTLANGGNDEEEID
jgi:SPP1 family phage portal protein